MPFPDAHQPTDSGLPRQCVPSDPWLNRVCLEMLRVEAS